MNWNPQTWFKPSKEPVNQIVEYITPPKTDNAAFYGVGPNVVSNTGYIPVFTKAFNGEKTAGELGNPILLIPDYRALRLRAYEADLTSDVVKIITGKFFKWVIGTGLKFQAEPNDTVLKLEGVTENITDFKSNVEAYFSLWADNTRSDYSSMCNLHENAAKAFDTAFIGGDCLTVLRVDDKYNLSVQVIDGQHLVTPVLNSVFMVAALANGNIILHGIEINEKGEHVAFYVQKMPKQGMMYEYERIEAIGKESGCLMAWVNYGLKHRIDHLRGIPAITSILEKVAKLDRYTEASVSSAEERAKVPWTIEHDNNSTGENPLIQKIRNNSGVNDTLDNFNLAGTLANVISETENKKVYNMPIGSKFAPLNSDAEIKYDTFFQAIFLQICAAVDIPPEVAVQQYNSNYSASRAAINGWDYIVKIYRNKHANAWYKKVYQVWLYIHIMRNKVNASGYLIAKTQGNCEVVEAYNSARFTGTNMPHIDPLKEVNAVRKMLGDETTPLMSLEQASEQLNQGDWDQNYKKYSEEIKTVTPPKPEEDATNSQVKK